MCRKPLRVLGPEDGSIDDGLRGGKEIVRVEECCSPRFWTEGEEGQSEEEDQWNEGCLARFSKFMGFPIDGYEDEIVVLMKKISSRRKKGKGGQTSTKFDKELKKLEWTVRDRRHKGGALGREQRRQMQCL